MNKEDSVKILKDLKDKGLKKLKEQNIPDKLKNLKDKGLEKLEEQNFQEKFKNLKDKGLEVAKDAYNKNKSDDAKWRKFLFDNPKVKYALYGLCGLLVIYCIMQNIQKVYTSSDVKCDDNKYCTTTDGTPITGIYKSYYKSGALEVEVNFKDGKPEGIAKSYYESGALKTEENYKNGKAEGISKHYYESGELETEITYRAGKRNGIAKWFYESRELKTEQNYKNGKVEGIAKNYYKSGELKSEITYRAGKRNGIAKWFYESGELETISKYKQGKLIQSEAYDENGDIIDKGYTITLICADGRFGYTMIPCVGEEYSPTQLTISEGGNQRSYSRYEIPQLEISVKSNFQYRLWNGSENFSITVKIYDNSTGKTYTRSVSPRSWDEFGG